jgi:ABC-type nickel/cobalt efflux system permease component RcnA
LESEENILTLPSVNYLMLRVLRGENTKSPLFGRVDAGQRYRHKNYNKYGRHHHENGHHLSLALVDFVDVLCEKNYACNYKACCENHTSKPNQSSSYGVSTQQVG